MFIRKFMLALAILSLGTTLAKAQETDSDRYSLEKSESGFVRLDRQTGTVT
jgi:hypothetical protein